MCRSKLIVLTGPPGVGKFTVAGELKKLFNFEFIEGHALYLKACEKGEWGTDEFFKRYEFDRLHVLEEFLKSGLTYGLYNCAFAHPHLDSFVTKSSALARKYDGKIIWRKLVCDQAELHRRVVSGSRKRALKLNSPEELDRVIEQFQLLDPFPHSECITIDTTDQSPEQAARSLLASIEEIS